MILSPSSIEKIEDAKAKYHQLLKSVRKFESGTPFTHVTKSSDISSQGRYFIDSKNLNQQSIICNAVRSGVKITLMEHPSTYGPMRIDIDLVSPIEEGQQRKYTEDTLKTLVKLYQDEIKSVVKDVDYDDSLTICIVLEKEAARVEKAGDKSVLKDGFHLHFPNFICDGRMQDYYMRNRILTKVKENGLFENLGYKNVDNIFDKDIAKKEWLIYGAMNYKNDKSTPYSYNRKQSNLDDYGDISEDPWFYANKEWGHVYDSKLNEMLMHNVFKEKMQGKRNSVKYYLPILLSIQGYTSNDETPLKDDVQKKLLSFGSNKSKISIKKRAPLPKYRNEDQIYEDIKTIKDGHIMEMIKNDDNPELHYDDWLNIGYILFNITNGGDEGLQMWIDFSMKSNKFQQGVCETHWNTMEIKPGYAGKYKTIAGLLAIARKDSPIEYNKWKNSNVNYYIKQSIMPKKINENDVATVVKTLSGDRFKYTGHDWYEFHNHRYRKMIEARELLIFFTKDVVAAYTDYLKILADQYNNEIAGVADVDALKLIKLKYGKLQDMVLNVVHGLKTNTFQMKVISQCKLLMTDSTFYEKMNQNTTLFCCENGVLDLELGIFRDGSPDDYCTYSCKQHYREYNEDDDDVLELDQYLSKVFVNPNIRQYTLDAASTSMEGGNIHKRSYIATGGTDGGKSAFFKLLGKAFGEYMAKFPRTLFIVGKGSSASNATPELSVADGKRIMSTQELTFKDRFNIGIYKELTGNDEIYTRKLYSNDPRDIFPMFTLWFQMNKPPEMPDDEASWGRTRLIPCETRFVKPQNLNEFPVPDTLEKQIKKKRFHADPNFSKKIPELVPVFLWRLFKNYNRLKALSKEGNKEYLFEPEEVLAATNAYKLENDVYTRFKNARIRKVSEEEFKKDQKNCYIIKSVMYDEFKRWYSEVYPGDKPPGTDEMTKELNKKSRLGISKTRKSGTYGYGLQNRWWGYKLVSEEDKENKEDDKND